MLVARVQMTVQNHRFDSPPIIGPPHRPGMTRDRVGQGAFHPVEERRL